MTKSVTNRSTFLAQRKERELSQSLSRWLVLGLLISAIAMTAALANRWFNPVANLPLWNAVGYLGVALLVTTLIFPAMWSHPERVLRHLGSWIGHALFSILLTIIYFAMFWPVGVWYRRRRGSHPIYAWIGQKPPSMEGWRLAAPQLEEHVTPDNLGKRRGIFYLLSFFVRRGNIIFIPATVLLVSLGLILFFVQSSAFAPFIYTLF